MRTSKPRSLASRIVLGLSQTSLPQRLRKSSDTSQTSEGLVMVGHLHVLASLSLLRRMSSTGRPPLTLWVNSFQERWSSSSLLHAASCSIWNDALECLLGRSSLTSKTPPSTARTLMRLGYMGKDLGFLKVSSHSRKSTSKPE